MSCQQNTPLTRHEYGLAETSKAVKRVLVTLYPKTKWSVCSKSYANGCSIHVAWTDGPTSKPIYRLIQVFACASFDGMVDLKSYVAAPEWNGHVFDFTGDYLFAGRGYSHALLSEAAARFARETGLESPMIEVGDSRAWPKRDGAPCGWSFFTSQPDDYPEGVLCRDEHGHLTAGDVVNEIAGYTSKESPTLPLTDETAFRILLGELPEKTRLDVFHTDSQEPDGSPAEPVAGITVTENTAKGGLEIRFPSKPETTVLAALKRNGWRWSRFCSCPSFRFCQRIGTALAVWETAC